MEWGSNYDLPRNSNVNYLLHHRKEKIIMSTKHKHYDLAYRAHYNTSFTPDKRAESWCAEFDHNISELKKANVPDQKIERYEALWIKHMQSKSRCLSSMITGPAKFPVAKAEKASNAERRAGDECSDYYNKILNEAKKEAFYEANPNARPVMSGDADAVDRLKSKLDAAKKAQETMIAVNKIVRKNPIDRPALVALLGSEEKVDEILKPDCFGGIGFASFSLTNNRSEIKRLEGRISEIENRKAVTPKELNINGVKIVENPEAMRLQLFFNGKPSPDMIAVLKSNAFKWSPSISAWQRQLTNNAVYSFNHFVLPKIKELTQ